MAGHYRNSNPFKTTIRTLVNQLPFLRRRLRRILIRRINRVLSRLQRRRRRTATAGFVLPTTVLMLLVIALTVGALIHRAYSHTTQIIGESQQRVIYNAATPAIDRARAKLETLFDTSRDNRYPGGVPAENYLAGMLRNDGSYNVSALPGAPATDMYTLPGEMRINLDGQVKAGETRAEDNAWAFRTDTNGDGNPDATVVYAIIMQTPPDLTITNANGGAPQSVPGSGIVSTSDRSKAQNLWVRTAPLSNRQRGNCGTVDTQVASAEQGWFQDFGNSSTLRKNFQIDAMVIPDTATNRPSFVTLEMQQDRQLDRGNKWGAWFRNDLEIFPGAGFNWNGAMHTEGNLIIRPSGSGSFTAYLVSAQSSCLMSTPGSSEITVTNILNAANDPAQKPDFVGGVLSASLRDNSYGGGSNVHVWPALANQPSQVVNLDTTTQSSNSLRSPAEMALNPVALLTRDVSLARGNDASNRSNVTNNWQGLPTDSRNPRIINQAEPKPYVDDLYRADDRWGPKPRYTDQIVLRGSGQQPGTLITSGNVSQPDDLTALINNVPPVSNPANVGLDGYWERRARNEGTRIIVGQRLELGNPYGWSNADPLYPPDSSLTHEQKQRRMLRDNLAAVQASAIYHSANPNGQDFPAACLASTSHPGSVSSLKNSITFSTLNSGAFLTNFLTGNGTNGWEFGPPAATEADFASSIASTQPLGKALRNLATFAGDYVSDSQHGAFPPTQEAAREHPYQNLTMWGNFSELRRTLARLDGGVAYSNLSIADKTNLHTAACTLGMLAYNINTLQGYDINLGGSNKNDSGGKPGLSKLGTIMAKLVDGNIANNNGEVRDPATGNYLTVADNGTQKRIDQINGNLTSLQLTELSGKYSALPPEAFINALLTEDLGGSYSTADRLALVDLARSVIGKRQIDRDRIYGFRTEDAPPASPTTTWATNGGIATAKIRNTDVPFKTACDPKVFNTNNGVSDSAQRDQLAALALSFCENTPRYPALFYVFPKENHDHDGDANAKTTINVNKGNAQPTNEPYITDTYISSTVNGSYQYQVVGSSMDDFTGVSLTPKSATFSDWVLPNATQQTIAGANVSPNLIVGPNGTRAVGFLERAIFNGREMMTTRVMDIDLGMLRSVGSSATSNQPWLPVSGIMYAFREDAVREDAIARPAGGTQTNATTIPGSDPARVTTPEGIQTTTKQVDYIPDPDRRPHGFRLRNGAQVKRNNSFGIAITNNIRGLSFFTDDPVYIQGNFNLHQTGGDDTVGSPLEEFTEQLNGDYSQFYNRSTRDSNFARPASDRWRPTEILADAIHILSDNFCDGSILDTFVSPTATVYHNTTTPGLWGPGCSGSTTSFTNQNLPTSSATWLRENAGDATSPVKIDRNGRPLVGGNTVYSGSYQGFNDNKSAQWMAAQDGTQVNAIVVSGIVASQPNQAYGGLHNFPRFLENWGSRTLRFSGAFLQLNFSNYGTGPYDQDAWEPGSSPVSAEYLQYYQPPTRAWGYDTGLQLAPAGPAAARFVTASRNRNEFYSELAVSDAYMNQLCTAFNTTNKSGALAGAPASVPCP